MNKITWNETLSVNVKEIDEQHKKLIIMINKLYDILHATPPRKNLNNEIHTILLKMIDYSIIHFETEEKYFKKFDYKEAQAHQKEHVEFSKKVLDFNRLFDTGKKDLEYTITGFLLEWLKDHILTTDKKYTDCFNSHGLY